jgi:polar amino acid transport system substrate-binding protein
MPISKLWPKLSTRSTAQTSGKASHVGEAVSKHRWFLACVIAVAIAVGGVAACGSTAGTGSTGSFRPVHSGTLTVATAFFPTPGFWEGRPEAPSGGFEWNLAQVLAKRFGLANVTVVPISFGDLIAGRLHGADLALSELTPTSERQKVLDFTTPYLVAPPGVVVRPGTSTPDLAALRSLRWVTLNGSTLTTVVANMVRPEHRPLAVDGRPQALEAIDTRMADAMLLDLPVALALDRSMPGRYKVSAQLEGSEGLAAAMPRGSNNLEAVDTAIRAFLADGTIDKLSARWLGAKLGTGDQSLPLIRTEG